MNDQPTPARDFATNALRGRSLRGIPAGDLADDVMHAIEQHYVVIHKSELRARDEAIVRATRDELATMRAHDNPIIFATDFDQMVDAIIAAAEQKVSS